MICHLVATQSVSVVAFNFCLENCIILRNGFIFEGRPRLERETSEFNVKRFAAELLHLLAALNQIFSSKVFWGALSGIC